LSFYVLMTVKTFLCALLLVSRFAVAADAQDGPLPGQQNIGAITSGSTLYRARCAECHGADGKGVAGHDLTRLWTLGATDERVFQTIRNGVPNTIMPSSTAPDGELRALIAYLRSLNGPPVAEPLRGNAESGERIFATNCSSCHAINGRGGRLGPDLSRIAQSRAQLTEAIRSPANSIAAGYQPVTVVTRDGERVTGALKGEDAFSVQLMDTTERLRAYMKSSLKSFVRDPGSLMPEYGPNRVSESDLDDLIRYLSTFRAATAGRLRGQP
jgi:putative heme-binding domain-containing protein